jgi:hypothetical protein
MKFMLKAPGTKRLKLKCNKLLSTFAFNFNLRRYREVGRWGEALVYQYLLQRYPGKVHTRGLHSSISQLNLSRF